MLGGYEKFVQERWQTYILNILHEQRLEDSLVTETEAGWTSQDVVDVLETIIEGSCLILYSHA